MKWLNQYSGGGGGRGVLHNLIGLLKFYKEVGCVEKVLIKFIQQVFDLNKKLDFKNTVSSQIHVLHKRIPAIFCNCVYNYSVVKIGKIYEQG